MRCILSNKYYSLLGFKTLTMPTEIIIGVISLLRSDGHAKNTYMDERGLQKPKLCQEDS